MTTASDVALIGGNSIVREGLRRLFSEQNRHILFAGATLDDLCKAGFGGSACLLLLIEDQGAEWSGGALAEAHRRCPAARIAMLVNQFDFDAMLEAFRSGAEGYLTNDLSWERLTGYLDLIALGEKIFPSQLAQKLIDQCTVCDQVPNAATIESANLSGREMEILRRLVAGSPNKVISRQLSISEATVKVHVKAVLRKLRVMNRTQAAIWAATHGMEGLAANSDESLPLTTGVLAARSIAGAAPAGAAKGYAASV